MSRRENAFEVLANLFLCKIVDELENPDDLKFYWKGIAYDNYFDLVDRLQSLYKIGMERSLDNGIKQSEGQFFTPVPICKFVVSRLPLEQLITQHNEPLRAIDYACGSGHFLTEYAQQLPALLQIMVPIFSVAAQNQMIPDIDGIEQSIATAQTTIAAAPAQKQAILQKYL